MLVVRAEIWPGGDGRHARTIGEMLAANESDLSPISSYMVVVHQAPAHQIGLEGWTREFALDGHRRDQGVWALVAAILDQLRGDESSALGSNEIRGAIDD